MTTRLATLDLMAMREKCLTVLNGPHDDLTGEVVLEFFKCINDALTAIREPRGNEAHRNVGPVHALDDADERTLWREVAIARLGRNGATVTAAIGDADAVLAAYRRAFGPQESP